MLLEKKGKNMCKKLQIFHQIQKKLEEKKVFSSHALLYNIKLWRGRENSGE